MVQSYVHQLKALKSKALKTESKSKGQICFQARTKLEPSKRQLTELSHSVMILSFCAGIFW